MNLKDKQVLVVGLAVTGVPLVRVLSQLGVRVIVNDIKTEEELQDSIKQLESIDIEYILGKHPDNLEEMGEIDLAVISPGVPLHIPFIQKLRERKIEIIGEIELAYRLSKARLIAITGTNGKTTTTALTGEIFKNAGRNTYVVGNIGVAAISKALETTPQDIMVMEVSSFQLESIKQFRPHVAAILNLTPDHLDRHKTMENYKNAKFSIFKNQTPQDYAIINYDDAICRESSQNLASKKIYFSRRVMLEEGVFVENQLITIHMKGVKHIVVNIDDIRIPGAHNLENALAATAMAFVMGIQPDVIAETLKNFPGVQHRTELVDTINGVQFINDSKGTNTDASIKAVEAVKAPIILLAGGYDKGEDFTNFIKAFNGKVKYMFVYGKTGPKLFDAAKSLKFENVKIVKDLDEAVISAWNIAKEGDTILLSPACASWDMYKNFEQRGNHFKSIVSSLRGA